MVEFKQTMKKEQLSHHLLKRFGEYVCNYYGFTGQHKSSIYVNSINNIFFRV